jgi:hypothetical protein
MVFRVLRAITVVAAVIALVCVAEALGASSRVATPHSCGLVSGAPWTVVLKSPGGLRHGSKYNLYLTNGLSCADAVQRLRQLTRMTPTALRRVSFLASTGERLHCLPVALQKDIKSVDPRTAWGWCGTDVDRMARLGVMAASGTEFFWVTGDKYRGF